MTSASQIQWTNLEEAHEIIDLGNLVVDPSLPLATYKSADDPSVPGNQEIPASVWSAGYEPPSPYIANTTRNLQFNQSHFIASPDAPDGATTYVTTSDGYSWAAMSKAINALWPYVAADYSGPSSVNAYYAGNLVTTPSAGVVKVTANFKAQDMKFWANEGGAAAGSAGAVPLERYFVVDEWGNEYIMHASGKTTPSEVAAAFQEAVLPAGWTKSVRTLSEDLILNPAKGSDGSYHYLVFRDSADNTYHQIGWSGRGPLAAQVDGMPIWGGQSNDTLMGGAGHDLIHGAGGDDRVEGGLGSDTLWGDAGSDTLIGGAGNDILRGNEDADLLYGNLGDDVMYGNQGNDALYGGRGDDLLYGGQGDDTIHGGAGNDTIHGGAGNDLILTGTGADLIVLRDGFGQDTVLDFDGAAGDRVSIASGINGTGIVNFAGVQAVATADGAGDTLITLGDDQWLKLVGVATNQLQADWFLFG